MLMQGNAVLALAAALTWGGGDFSGGMGVKTAGSTVGGALRIVLLSHLTSLMGLLIFSMARGLAFPHGAVLAWGLAAGVAGGLSLTAFYIALAQGAMGAAAAVSGLLAAAIPAAVSIAAEGWPGTLKLAGFAVAGGAIWMIAAGSSAERANGRLMGLAVGAGAGFGLYFVALKMAGPAGPVWAMATARMGSLTVCSLLLAVLTLRGKAAGAAITRRSLLWVGLTAALDTSGNMLFVAATRAGRLDVAAVLASLYPATTILLAAWTLKERPTRRQGLGMVVALAAVVMITM